MDRQKFMEDCLHAHQDLLKLEQGVHEWLEQLAGFEVAPDGPAAKRPPRPKHDAPHAPTEQHWKAH